MKKINSKYVDTKHINEMIDDYNKEVESYIIKENKEIADLNNELVNTIKKVVENAFELEEPFRASRFATLCMISALLETAIDTYNTNVIPDTLDKLLDKLVNKLFGE